MDRSVRAECVGDETGRLVALARLQIAGSEPEAQFDQAARIAANVFDAPTAFVSLIEERRQWLKARIGADLSETPRNAAFCDYTIRTDQVFVVLDAHLDPRFVANPYVTGAPFVRFYAGAPLIAEGGHRVGAICVLDVAPRDAFLDWQRRGFATAARCRPRRPARC